MVSEEWDTSLRQRYESRVRSLCQGIWAEGRRSKDCRLTQEGWLALDRVLACCDGREGHSDRAGEDDLGSTVKPVARPRIHGAVAGSGPKALATTLGIVGPARAGHGFLF